VVRELTLELLGILLSDQLPVRVRKEFQSVVQLLQCYFARPTSRCWRPRSPNPRISAKRCSPGSCSRYPEPSQLAPFIDPRRCEWVPPFV
jgi:hypothetical protein